MDMKKTLLAPALIATAMGVSAMDAKAMLNEEELTRGIDVWSLQQHYVCKFFDGEIDERDFDEIKSFSINQNNLLKSSSLLLKNINEMISSLPVASIQGDFNIKSTIKSLIFLKEHVHNFDLQQSTFINNILNDVFLRHVR